MGSSTNHSTSTDIVRKFLLDAFSDEDLEALCFDNFPEVSNEFTAGMSKGEKIQLLLDYCRRRHLGNKLLSILRATRPEQYEQQLAGLSAAQLDAVETIPAKSAPKRWQPFAVGIGGLAGLALVIAIVLAVIRGGPQMSPTLAPTPTSVMSANAAASATAISSAPTTLTPTSIPHKLTVQIWDVQSDERHSLIASQPFVFTKSASSGGIPDETLHEVRQWITGQIKQRYGSSSAPVQARIQVPADLSAANKIQVELRPHGSFQKNLYTLESSNKAPADEETIAASHQDFYIEILKPGYKPVKKLVKWGQPLDETLSLEPMPISIGIEEFAGDNNSIAASLQDDLLHNTDFVIKDPATLKTLQDKIQQEKDAIAKNPMIQTAIRTSLGVDLIITGHYGSH